MPISTKAAVGPCPSTAPILDDTRVSFGPTAFESTISIVGGDLPCFCKNCVNAALNVFAPSVPYGMSTKLAAVPGLIKPRDRGSFGSRAGICQSKCSAAGAGPLAVTSPAWAPVMVQPSGKPMLPEPSGNGVSCSGAAGAPDAGAGRPFVGKLAAAGVSDPDGELVGAGAAGDSGADAGALAAADAGLLPVPDSPAPDCNLFSMGPTVERKRSAWSVRTAPFPGADGDTATSARPA